MNIPVSTMPAVRAYLVATLTAQLTPDPSSPSSALLVCFDAPGEYQPDDIVSVGKCTRQVAVSSMVGGGGAGWLEERYNVEITADVFRGGDDPQAAFSRSTALADAVAAVVRSDPSLGGNVLVARPLTSIHEVAQDDAHMGRHSTSVLEVECFQRI